MSLRPEHLARLAALDLPSGTMREVLAIIADTHSQSAGAKRQARYRDRKNAKTSPDSVTSDVTSDANVTQQVTGKDDPSRARSLLGKLEYTLEASASKGADAPLDPPKKLTTPDQALFERSRQIFGDKCGGQIAKLKSLFGGDVEKTRDAVEQAALMDSPKTYLAAIILRSGPAANHSRAGPANAYGTRNGKPSLSDFARQQDERVNGTYGNDQRSDASEIRAIPHWQFPVSGSG